jgi:hypothetical protein
MKSKLILESESGESVTALVTVQNTGRVSVVECLAALGIPKDAWTKTYLQIHVMLIPEPELKPH